MIRLPALLALLLASPAAAQTGPSFDCARAETPTERAICADTRLSGLDRTMADLYRRAVAVRPLRPEQLLWQRWRNTCGGDVPCLIRRYEQRIVDLGGPEGDGTTPAVLRRIRGGRTELVMPDGTIHWNSLSGGGAGMIHPYGTETLIMFSQVEVDAVPAFPPAATAWVASLEAPLLSTIEGLLDPAYHIAYREAQAALPLPARMFRHVEAIRFLTDD
jgi:hypothetical protein